MTLEKVKIITNSLPYASEEEVNTIYEMLAEKNPDIQIMADIKNHPVIGTGKKTNKIIDQSFKVK